TPQARCSREYPGLRHRLKRTLRPAFHLEREHAAELGHLPRRDRMTGVARQAGVVDGLDSVMLAKEPRDLQSILRVTAHAVRQGADAAPHQPAVQRRRDRPSRGLNLANLREEGIVPA